MVHNRVHEIIIRRFLVIVEYAVSHQETITVLIALPADDCRTLAHAVHREGRYRTATRDERNGDLRNISVIGDTELAEEHDVRTHTTHVVTIIVLKSHTVRLIAGMAEINRIYGNKGIQVTRVTHDTDNHLTVVGGGRTTASPEVNLVLADAVHKQLRHDRIRTYIRRIRADVISYVQEVITVVLIR